MAKNKLDDLPAERPSLDGRAVLVTGGSMGIGHACAREVLASGGHVTIAARGQGALEAAAERLAEEFGHDRVAAFTADVSREADVERLVTGARDRFGRLDGLIHAAAVIGPIGPTLDVSLDEWMDTIRVNLFGTLLTARAAARVMREEGGGRMVLLSGGGATSPFPRYTAYACSKVGVVRLGETLARELEPYGIAVNCLAPGFVATRMHEVTLAAGERAGADYLERTRQELEEGGVPPELSARTAVFLVSDAAEGITGRLAAAPWDAWWRWPEHRAEIEGSDLFTLRRIVPRDRGGDWQ